MNCELQYPKPGNHSDVEKYRSVLKKCPRSLVSQSPEKSGGGDLGSCKKPRLGRLADGQGGRNGNRVPWFFTITPLFGTIASWGFGVNIHHFEQEINLVGEKLWNKRNNQTRIARKVGAFFVYSDQRSSSLFRTFLSYEELSFFFLLLLLLFLLSVKTKHAAYLVYAVSVTLEGEETDETKDASSANRSRRRRAWLKAHPHDNIVHWSFPPLLFIFFSSLLYNHHRLRHSRVAEACCSYKAVCSCGWKIGL